MRFCPGKMGFFSEFLLTVWHNIENNFLIRITRFIQLSHSLAFMSSCPWTFDWSSHNWFFFWISEALQWFHGKKLLFLQIFFKNNGVNIISTLSISNGTARLRTACWDTGDFRTRFLLQTALLASKPARIICLNFRQPGLPWRPIWAEPKISVQVRVRACLTKKLEIGQKFRENAKVAEKTPKW